MDKEEIMRLVFIDIDNTLLDFDAYVKQTMQTGFAHFGLKPYEPYMFEVFTEENNRLWHQIEQGTLTLMNCITYAGAIFSFPAHFF